MSGLKRLKHCKRFFEISIVGLSVAVHMSFTLPVAFKVYYLCMAFATVLTTWIAKVLS